MVGLQARQEAPPMETFLAAAGATLGTPNQRKDLPSEMSSLRLRLGEAIDVDLAPDDRTKIDRVSETLCWD